MRDDHQRRAGWHHRRGVECERRDDWVGAAVELDAAAKLDPGWASRHYRLGNARERVWDLAGACDAYAAAVSTDPARAAWSQRLERARRAAAAFRPFAGLIVAHRGTTRGGPENTVAGLADLPATVAGVEVDVRLSRDGVPVLMHDGRVDRTTGGHGKVDEQTYPELSSLGVPALADYLAACHGRGFRQILLDLKAPTRPALRAIASAVRSSPVAKDCVALVRGEAQLGEFRDVGGDLRLGGLGLRVTNAAPYLVAARKHGAEVLLLAHGDQRYLDNRGAIATIHQAGLAAGGSIVNSREALEAGRVDGCDLLLTDRADQLGHFVGYSTVLPDGGDAGDQGTAGARTEVR